MLFQKQEMDRNWVRYRNNSLFSEQQDTETNYTPAFADIQTNINYEASDGNGAFLEIFLKINISTSH
jgi:hypothetical protein